MFILFQFFQISRVTHLETREQTEGLLSIPQNSYFLQELHNFPEGYLGNYYYYYYISSDYNIKKYFCQIAKKSIEYRVYSIELRRRKER